MIKYSEERLDDIISEIGGLLILHKQELRGDQFKLDVNWSMYKNLESKNMLHITTVRNDELLVGYCVFVLTHLAHYQNEKVANNDVFFLHKDYRKGLAGYKLLKKSIDFIKKRGVNIILMTVKLSKDYPQIFKRLGFKPIEKVYSMEV